MRRMAALTAASILALTLAPGTPALASLGPDAGVGERGARALLEAPAYDAVAGSVDRRRHVVLDPAGDARQHDRSGVRSQTWQSRLADLRRISYTTPTTDDGEIRVRADWTQLRGPRTQRAQRLVTFVYAPATERLWALLATSRGRVQLFELDERESAVRPEVLELRSTPGAGGRMEIRLSTEWLDAPVVRFVSLSSTGRASDETNPTRRLHVGARD